MAFILSFAFGAVIAPFIQIVAFLAIVATASAISFGIALAHGDTFASPLLRIAGEAVCAQIGYVAGVTGLALIVRARTREHLVDRVTAPRNCEDGRK